MTIRTWTGVAPVLLLLSLLAACQAENEDIPIVVANLTDAVSLDGLIEPVRVRPNREMTRFLGEYVWTVDYRGRLYTSADSGYTWAHIPLPSNGIPSALQVVGNGKRGVVVTEQGALMRTDDAGETWSEVDLREYAGEDADLEWGGRFETIKFDDALENGVWFGFCQIFRTNDGGQSWTSHADSLLEIDDGSPCVDNVVTDPETGSMFADVYIDARFMTSGNYLFSSEDKGVTWEELCSLDEVGMLVESVQSCFTRENLSDHWRVFVGEAGIGDMDSLQEFAENIGRDIFINQSLVIPEHIMGRLEFVGMTKDAESGRIWYESFEDLAYTDDDGEHWHVVASGMPESGSVDFSLGTDRGFGIYMGEYLAVSDDIGTTWQALNSEPTYFNDFVIVPEHNRIVVASDDGLAIVDTETLSWTGVNGIGSSSELEVAGSVIWSFTYDGEVHRSVDAGLSWNRLPVNQNSEGFYVSQASCNTHECVLVGSREDSAVARLSADPFGFDVTELSDQISELDEDYVVDSVFDSDLKRGWLAIDTGVLYGTDDGGRSWRELANLRDEITELSKSPGGPYIVARGYTDHYLWSGDGKDFERLRAPIGREGYLSSLCWINESVALMTAESDEGESVSLASTDGGMSWGPTEWVSFDDDCTIPGGLVVLDGMIARAN